MGEAVMRLILSSTAPFRNLCRFFAMNSESLISHLTSGGILARTLNGEVQFLRITVYGYGSATAKPTDALESVKAEPSQWVCLEAETPGLEMEAKARGLLEGK